MYEKATVTSQKIREYIYRNVYEIVHYLLQLKEKRPTLRLYIGPAENVIAVDFSCRTIDDDDNNINEFNVSYWVASALHLKPNTKKWLQKNINLYLSAVDDQFDRLYDSMKDAIQQVHRVNDSAAAATKSVTP